MKEYGKTFTGITDAHGFVILDIPFTATVIGATSPSGRTPQDLVCNKQNRMMRVIDNTVCIDLYGLRIMLSDNTEVNLNTTAITQTIISPYKNELISAEIGHGVTKIEENAFENCHALTSVTIPNSVTSIGYHAFNECSGLTGELVIPNSVTSIGGEAFHHCRGLTSVTIPNSITSIRNGTFWTCYGLTSVTIPNSVTSIGSRAFMYCYGLVSIIFTGTSSQWRAIERSDSNWHTDVPTTTVYCEGDGVTVSLDAT